MLERRPGIGPGGRQVERLMQALPAHYRDVLTCRFLLNISIRETATIFAGTLISALLLVSAATSLPIA